MPLDQNVLEWFYRLQEQLKNEFHLDTANKKDMGRLRVLRSFVRLDEEEKAVPENLRPRRPEESSAEVAVHVEDQYATVTLNENGTDYDPPLSADGDEDAAKELVSRQNTFSVTVQNGVYTMHSKMSSEQLERIYQDAKNGGLYVNQPDKSVLASETPSRFIGVAKDGKTPVFVDPYFIDTKNLSDEDFRDFYQNHPELKGKESTQNEAVKLADLEYGEYRKLSDPAGFRANVMDSLQNFQWTLKYADNDGVNEYFKVFFWQENAERLPPMPGVDTYGLLKTIPAMLSGEKVDVNIPGESGLDVFFTEDRNGEMKLMFADLDRIGGSPAARRLEIERRIVKAVDESELYVVADARGTNDNAVFRRIRRNEEGNIVCEGLHRRDEPAPEKPTWLQSLLHAIYSGWYTEICGEYERYEKDEKRLNETLPKAYRDKQVIFAPKKRAENRNTEVRTEESFALKLADGLLKRWRREGSVEDYLQLMGKTPQEFVKEEPFREFLQKPETVKAVQKYLKGENVRFSEVASQFLGEKNQKKTERRTVSERAPVGKIEKGGLEKKK